MIKILIVSAVLFLFHSTTLAQESVACSRDLEGIETEVHDLQTAQLSSTDQQKLFSAQSKANSLAGSLACLNSAGEDTASLESQLNALAEAIHKKMTGASASEHSVQAEVAKNNAAAAPVVEKIDHEKKAAEILARAEFLKRQQLRFEAQKQAALLAAQSNVQKNLQNMQTETQPATVQPAQPVKITQTAAPPPESQPSVQPKTTTARPTQITTPIDPLENERQFAKDLMERPVNVVKSLYNAAGYCIENCATKAMSFAQKKYEASIQTDPQSVYDHNKYLGGFVGAVFTDSQTQAHLAKNAKAVVTDTAKNIALALPRAVDTLYSAAKELADGDCKGVSCLNGTVNIAKSAYTIAAPISPASRTVATVAADTAKGAVKNAPTTAATTSAQTLMNYNSTQSPGK